MKKHFAILKKGVESWNKWRKDNSDTIPNLEGAHLERANLEGANLRKAILDFSSFQFRCNTFGFYTDPDFFHLISYHLCRIKCDDPEIRTLQEYLMPYANKAKIIERYKLPLITISEQKCV